ncbi:hypothetical protein KC726_00695 [Candidatus Woesebacteria bacterium]|nr:hypothetical protein [Candidatus Woesebacteria bacterium]
MGNETFSYVREEILENLLEAEGLTDACRTFLAEYESELTTPLSLWLTQTNYVSYSSPQEYVERKVRDLTAWFLQDTFRPALQTLYQNHSKNKKEARINSYFALGLGTITEILVKDFLNAYLATKTNSHTFHVVFAPLQFDVTTPISRGGDLLLCQTMSPNRRVPLALLDISLGRKGEKFHKNRFFNTDLGVMVMSMSRFSEMTISTQSTKMNFGEYVEKVVRGSIMDDQQYQPLFDLNEQDRAWLFQRLETKALNQINQPGVREYLLATGISLDKIETYQQLFS